MKMTQRLSRGALMLAMAAAPMALRAQTATVSGYLGAFDVVNVGSQPAHGFEIRIEGAQPNDLYYTVFGGRYGTPSIVPYATGVAVRYTSIYNASTGQWSATTGMHTPGAPFGWNDCYQAGANYANSGCEHFGQSLRPTPAGQITAITGRWLVEDTSNPGSLIAMDPPAAIPFAFWSVAPPASTTPAAPIVVAEVQAPEPPETPETYGDAQWMKVFVTQLARELTADELTSGNVSV